MREVGEFSPRAPNSHLMGALFLSSSCRPGGGCVCERLSDCVCVCQCVCVNLCECVCVSRCVRFCECVCVRCAWHSACTLAPEDCACMPARRLRKKTAARC